jgi:hypothetical protein
MRVTFPARYLNMGQMKHLHAFIMSDSRDFFNHISTLDQRVCDNHHQNQANRPDQTTPHGRIARGWAIIGNYETNGVI